MWPASSDKLGPGPSLQARRPEEIFLSPARPEPDFLKADSIEKFESPAARRNFSSPTHHYQPVPMKHRNDEQQLPFLFRHYVSC